VKPYRKFLYILWMFIAGCAVGGFDISQPLVKLRPEAVERVPERVDWLDYSEAAGLAQEEACILYYFKTEQPCGQCDLMDQTFKNQEAVYLLNNNFITYKGTDDLPDGEKEIANMPGDVPAISIVAGGAAPRAIFGHSEGNAIPLREFIGILKESLGKCNAHYKRKSGQ